MSLESINLQLVGTTPLCMHSPQAADPLCQHPLYPAFKSLSKKRAKTEEDHIELARLEWMLSLYVDAEGKIFTPGRCWEVAFRDTAKRQKLGKKFTAAVLVEDAVLKFKGDNQTPDELWAGNRHMMRIGMTVGTARVMRTTPIFREWSADLTVRFMPSEVDENVIREVAATCGAINGSFEYRPRHGRFEVK